MINLLRASVGTFYLACNNTILGYCYRKAIVFTIQMLFHVLLNEALPRVNSSPDMSQHENLIRIAYAQKRPIKPYMDIPNGAKWFICMLYVYLYPYFVYTSSESSGESAHMRRLA